MRYVRVLLPETAAICVWGLKGAPTAGTLPRRSTVLPRGEAPKLAAPANGRRVLRVGACFPSDSTSR